MEQKRRKATRLKGFDYSQNGAYFITICVKDMKCVLAEIVGADDLGSPLIFLTDYGTIAEKNIVKMNSIYDNIAVDNYIIMPNHIHLLVSISNEKSATYGAPRSSPPTNGASGTPLPT